MEHTSVVHKAYHRAVVERLEAENARLRDVIQDVVIGWDTEKEQADKLRTQLAECEAKVTRNIQLALATQQYQLEAEAKVEKMRNVLEAVLDYWKGTWGGSSHIDNELAIKDVVENILEESK